MKLSRRNLLASLPALGALPFARAALAQEPEHQQHGGAAPKPESAHAGHGDGTHVGTVGAVDHKANGFDPHAIVRDFDTGSVRREGGRTVREWELIAQDKEIEVAPGVKF